MGIGTAAGDNRAVTAAKLAITSPLLEASIEGARGILLNIAGGSDLGLFEVNEAAEIIHGVAHPDANIIFGQVIDDSMGDEVRVTVIAAGFERWDDQPARERSGNAGYRAARDRAGVARRRGSRARRRRVRRPGLPEVAMGAGAGVHPADWELAGGIRVRCTGWAQGDLGGAGSVVQRRRRAVVDLPWTVLTQVHGARVVVVEGPGGAAGEAADAAVATGAGAALAVLTADCAPVAPGQPRGDPRCGARRLEGSAGRCGRGDGDDDAPAWSHAGRGCPRAVHPPLLLPVRFR